MSATIQKLVGRIFGAILTAAIAFTFVGVEFPYFSSTEAHAQVKKSKKRKNFFETLFGKRGSLRNKRRKKSSFLPGVKRLKRAKRIRLKTKKNKKSIRRAAVPKIPVIEKSETASTILVAGDFMAGSLAKGLSRAYADNSDIVVVNISKGLSGFVRNDVKDWPADIAKHVEELKPIAIVFLNGMNDRQQMKLATGRVPKLSEAWLAEYNIRTKSLATNIRGKKIPLVWMGLPPVRSGKMSTDYRIFNDIYKSQAEAVGGTYVDIWDGFTNEEGQFVSAGPDINGQIKRLRASDGINMNNTGKRKLAFYAKKALRKYVGVGGRKFLASLPGLTDRGPTTPQYDPAKSGRTVVYSLANPNIDGSEVLAGADQTSSSFLAKKSVSYDLVHKGELPKTHLGRVDHYGIVANEASQATILPVGKLRLKTKQITQ